MGVSVKTSTSCVDKNKMPCVIENSKPRKKNGRLFLTYFLVLMLSLLMTFCLMDSDGDSIDIKSFLNIMLLPFIPLLTGIYLHYFIKANTIEEFKKHFSMINAKEKFIVNMGAMMVFLIIWSGGLVELMMTMVTVTPCVLVFLRLGLHTNKLEDEIRLPRP